MTDAGQLIETDVYACDEGGLPHFALPLRQQVDILGWAELFSAEINYAIDKTTSQKPCY